MFALGSRLFRWSRTPLLALALASIGASCAAPNLPFPTLGGKQFWADEQVDHGWRIQRHLLTGHYRLLDRFDIRRAWGRFGHCVEQLEASTEVLPAEPRHAVVLLPGILRSKDSLAALARDLRGAGYRVVDVNYPSILRPIREHADQVERVVARLEGVERVSFVTHSMGGLVARELLGRRHDDADPQLWTRSGPVPVHGVCTLFTPHRGAHLAEAWHDNWLYQLIYGPAGQELRPEVVRRIAIPRVPFACFAGGRGDGEGRSESIPGDDDGTVGVDEARLDGAHEFRLFDVGHTFGMNDDSVRRAVLDFLAGA